MDESKWMSVLITALIGSAIVCVLILLINESGKRGQAITWLPAALATTVAVTHISNPTELERLLRTAFSALFISGSFIMSFYMLLNTILPDNPKDITAERQNTILITTIVLALIIPGLIVFLVEEYAHPFWSLILGFIGVGLVIVNVMCSKRLHFKNQTIKLGFKAFCCCGCHKKISKKEIYMLIGAVIGTFTFVIIPALLSDAGYANWAGIIANAPKVTVLIMVSLWVNRPKAISVKDEIELKHEIREHLTMFSYSTSITGIYIIIMWWNESQKKPENFWWAWTISLLLSLAFITGILVPVCLQSSKPKGEEGPHQQDESSDVELKKLLGSTLEAISGPEIGSGKIASEVLQGRPKLKW